MPLVEAGPSAGPEVEAIVAESLAPLLGERDEAGEFVFPLPASARIDTLLLGCTHYPLLRPVIAAIAGERVAIVDSRDRDGVGARRAAGDQRPRGAGHDPRHGRRRRRDRPRAHDEVAAAATHVQLTTGDVDAFRVVAERIFGEAFPDVGSVEVGGGWRRERIGDPRRAADDEPRQGPGWRDDRVWQAGFLVGSAHRGRGDGPRPARRAGRPAGPRRLAGRRAVRGRAAASRAGDADARPSCGRPSRSTPPRWSGSCRASSAALGTELPGVVERSAVVDRAGWVHANVATFAQLIGQLEGELLDQVDARTAAASPRRRWPSPTAG